MYPKMLAPGSPQGLPSQTAPSISSESVQSSCSTTENIQEVWSWNFEEKLRAFLLAVACAGANVVIALDVKFPSFLRQTMPFADPAAQYEVLRDNVNLLQPLQIGFAVADEHGAKHGTWNFNLLFDHESEVDIDTSFQFLQLAGIDVHCHASYGIHPYVLGRRLMESALISTRKSAPLWVSFSGDFDLAFFLSILSNEPLPERFESYHTALSTLCPNLVALRDALPSGSLDSLCRTYGIERCDGAPHAAGSDALVTLELYFRSACTSDPTRYKVQPSSTMSREMNIATRLAAAMDELEDSYPEMSVPSWGAAARWASLANRRPRFSLYKAVSREAVAGGA